MPEIAPQLTLTAEPTTVGQGDTVTLFGYLNIQSAGDVNGDGVIDMKDITATIRAFGAKPGDPKWNPNADLNKDGVIDMHDITESIRRFGQSSSNKPVYIQRSYDGVNWETIAELKTYYDSTHYIAGAFSYQYYVTESPPKTIYFRAYFPGGVY